MTSAPISSVHIAKHCARLGATSVVTFTVLVGLQWSSTWVPEEDVAAGLDDGSARITNLDPRPGNRRTEQLAEHLQFMECEFAELSLGRVQRGFYPTRWQAAVFAPNRSNALSETLLSTCKGSHASFQVVDHRGWEFIGPRIEVLRRTGRIVGEESPGPDPCELEPWGEPPPGSPYKWRLTWQRSEECAQERLAVICAEWLHPRCAIYAAAPPNAKPFKPRYWYGANTLHTLALSVMPLDRMRSLTATVGLLVPGLFLLALGMRSRPALVLVGPLAVLGWWSQSSFGLWSLETGVPQSWAWIAGAVAAWTAGRRNAAQALLACGMVQGFFWLLDTGEVLGFGLAVLAAYAVARKHGEDVGLKAGLSAGVAYAAGFALAIVSGWVFRHVVYESTIAVAYPQMSGYVWENVSGQFAARAIDNMAGPWGAWGLGGALVHLAWTWSLLTTMDVTKAVFLHAACYIAMAAHLCREGVVGVGRALGRRRVWSTCGATGAGLLVLATVYVQTTLWNDDWVRVERMTILIPGIAWMWAMSHILPRMAPMFSK